MMFSIMIFYFIDIKWLNLITKKNWKSISICC